MATYLLAEHTKNKEIDSAVFRLRDSWLPVGSIVR